MNIALIAHDEKKELMVQFCMSAATVTRNADHKNLRVTVQYFKSCSLTQIQRLQTVHYYQYSLSCKNPYICSTCLCLLC